RKHLPARQRDRPASYAGNRRLNDDIERTAEQIGGREEDDISRDRNRRQQNEKQATEPGIVGGWRRLPGFHQVSDSPWRSCCRCSGNRITSRMLGEFVSSITSRSIPTPSPPAGGIPCSRADRKSSSITRMVSSPSPLTCPPSVSR